MTWERLRYTSNITEKWGHNIENCVTWFLPWSRSQIKQWSEITFTLNSTQLSETCFTSAAPQNKFDPGPWQHNVHEVNPHGAAELRGQHRLLVQTAWGCSSLSTKIEKNEMGKAQNNTQITPRSYKSWTSAVTDVFTSIRMLFYLVQFFIRLLIDLHRRHRLLHITQDHV